jgi:hypothetical protein
MMEVKEETEEEMEATEEEDQEEADSMIRVEDIGITGDTTGMRSESADPLTTFTNQSVCFSFVEMNKRTPENIVQLFCKTRSNDKHFIGNNELLVKFLRIKSEEIDTLENQ